MHQGGSRTRFIIIPILQMRKLRLMRGSRDSSRGSGHVPAARAISDEPGPDPSRRLESQKPVCALGPQASLLPKRVSTSLVST